MNVQEYDYNLWLTALAADKKWKPDVDENFLQAQLSLFSKIPLIKNETGKYDATLILTELKKEDINIVRLISFLYRCNRSSIIKSQTISPELGSLTPLVLYAHKKYNNVQYNEWDKASLHLKFFLGKALEPLLSIHSPITLTNDEVINLRKEALGDNPIVGYRIKKFKYNNKVYSSMTVVGRLLLQTWLANARLRNTESMILDPFSWEKVPETVDVEINEESNLWDII